MDRRLFVTLGAVLSQLLASCVVYMPMQCAAPQITDKKQAEVTGSSYLNGRVEAAGTYSPLRHLLVRAAYSTLRSNSKDTTYYHGHQYDLGVGTYWHLGDSWLVGAIGGVGQAQSEAAYSTGGFIFGHPTPHQYTAHSNKLFGEVYGTFQASNAFSMGAAYRVTQVNFTTLTDYRIPVELTSMTRSEPMFFVRVRVGSGPVEDRPVHFQLALGMSSTFGYNENDPNTSYPDGVRDLKQGRGYTTLGITVFPHCFFRKAQPGSEGP